MWTIALISLFLTGLSLLTVYYLTSPYWLVPLLYANDKYGWTLFGVIVPVILMVILGIAVTGQRRWLAFSLVAILMMVVSVPMLHLSIGALLGYPSLLLLIFSVARLIYLRANRGVWG